MRTLPRGIYTAVPTFFKDNEELDIGAFKKHVEYVACAGTVPVPTGTMGEACHLTAEERCTLISVTRSVLNKHSSTKSMPVIAGVAAPSTKETIALACAAAGAGADFAMVIPPGYYAGILKSDGMRAIKRYFIDVSEASPIPVIVYNFPAVSSGIDMDSDVVVDMFKNASNICGMKFTCANVAKITRITATLADPKFQEKYPRRYHAGVGVEKESIPYFSAIDGLIDILLASVSARTTGAITAISNIVPRCCVKLWELSEKSHASWENHAEAQKLQDLISLADGDVQKVGIAGMKQVLKQRFGYSEYPRRPLLPMSIESLEFVLRNQALKQLTEYEIELAKVT